MAFSVAVACSDMVTMVVGGMRADKAAQVSEENWQRLGCADGSRGPRLCDWALITAALLLPSAISGWWWVR